MHLRNLAALVFTSTICHLSPDESVTDIGEGDAILSSNAGPLTKVCGKATCANAGKPQPIASFATDAKSKDGRKGTCRECVKAGDAARKGSAPVQTEIPGTGPTETAPEKASKPRKASKVAKASAKAPTKAKAPAKGKSKATKPKSAGKSAKASAKAPAKAKSGKGKVGRPRKEQKAEKSERLFTKQVAAGEYALPAPLRSTLRKLFRYLQSPRDKNEIAAHLSCSLPSARFHVTDLRNFGVKVTEKEERRSKSGPASTVFVLASKNAKIPDLLT